MENCKFDPNQQCLPLDCVRLSTASLDASDRLTAREEKRGIGADYDEETIVGALSLSMRDCALEQIGKIKEAKILLK
jgi:hypothetical protein